MRLDKKSPSDPQSHTFSYQRDTYTISSPAPSQTTFTRLPYPSSARPPLHTFLTPTPLKSKAIPELTSLYGLNEFNTPIPSFTELFSEHATAPFFVFQIFCVALWCLNEYWYFSLFTLFMLVVFECTVVWQVGLSDWVESRVLIGLIRTLTESRTSVAPYPIQCLRDDKWQTLQMDKVLPGNVVSIGESPLISH